MKIWAAQLLVIVVTAAPIRCEAGEAGPPYATTAIRIADFLLSLQDAEGALRDSPGADIVNEDSNMEYALMGLARAYEWSGGAQYLRGLEHGIRWLGNREEMKDTSWRGSWFYAYDSKPPYQHHPVSPGPEIADVRGVDATSALFAYLVYLHDSVSTTDPIATAEALHVRAALDFVLAHNQGVDGLFDSSWQLQRATGTWTLWRYQYTADQADVYLGMRAGWLLYGDSRYRLAADQIRRAIVRALLIGSLGRYAVGRAEGESPDRDLDGFDGVFPQGYVPWVFGSTPADKVAFKWMKRRRQPDGSLVCFKGDPRYSLSALIYALAAASLGDPAPQASLRWVVVNAFDPSSGGVRDTAAVGSPTYSNVAGFAVMALLGVRPL